MFLGKVFLVFALPLWMVVNFSFPEKWAYIYLTFIFLLLLMIVKNPYIRPACNFIIANIYAIPAFVLLAHLLQWAAIL